VEKYDITRDAIYDNIIQCLHFVAKATDRHSKYAAVVVEKSEWFCCVP
jgi:predicted DNA-binding protein YlxM (UPF0122 family)